MTEHPGSQCNGTAGTALFAVPGTGGASPRLRPSAARSDADARTAIEATSRGGESQTDTNPVAVAETHASPVAKPSSSRPRSTCRAWNSRHSGLSPTDGARGWRIPPVAAASALDGRAGLLLSMPPAGHRQPVGLAGPLPDGRPASPGTGRPGLDGLRVEVDPRSSSRRSRASLARGSSRSRPPAVPHAPGLGPLSSRGPATDGSPTAPLWKGSSRPGGSIIPSPLNWKLVEPGTSSSPGARASASWSPSPTPPSKTPRPSRPPSACSNPTRPGSSCNGWSVDGRSPARRSTSTTSIARPKGSKNTSSASPCPPSSRSSLEKPERSRDERHSVPG